MILVVWERKRLHRKFTFGHFGKIMECKSIQGKSSFTITA